MSYCKFISVALLVLIASSSGFANVEVQVQPTEIIRATPLTLFTDRVGTWPTYGTPNDIMQTESEPVERYINTIPGVQARSASGSPTVSIRGSSQAGRTLSLFNGVPLFLSDGFGAPKLLLPQEILSGVRVLKGPASVFYGPAAMAGALNYTPRLFEDPAVRISVNDQGDGLAHRSILGVIPHYSGKSDFVQLSLYGEGDPGDYKFESVTTKEKSRRIYNSSKTHRLTLLGQQSVSAWTLKESLVFATSEGTLPGPVTALSPLRFDTTNLMAAVSANGRLSDELDFEVGVSHLSDNDEFEGIHTATTTRELITTDFTQTLVNGWVIHTFLDAAHDKIKSTTLNKERSPTDNIELGQIWEVPLGNGFQLQPGARWLQEFDKFVPAISLSHSGETTSTWMTFSEGFRKPSLYDLYFTDPTYQANPNLKPETAKQIEIGFLKSPNADSYSGKVTWSVSVFGIDYSNFFDNENISPGLVIKVNRGDAVSYGGETSIGLEFGTRTVTLAYSHLQGEIKTTNEPLTLSPKHQVSFSVTQGLGPVVIELKDTYASSFYDRDFALGLKKLPDSNLVDLNFRSLGLTNWEFKTGILNLFNEARELTIGYPEPQRTFYFSALRYL